MNRTKINQKTPRQPNELVNKWGNKITAFSFLIVLVLTLFPYRFFFREIAPSLDYDYLIDQTTRVSHLDDLILNVLLFIPVGFGFSCWTYKRQLRGTISLFLVGAACFAFSLTIEILQLFLPARTTSFVDLITNTMGGFLGFLCFWFYGESILSYISTQGEKFKTWLTPNKLAAAFVGYLALTFFLSIPLQNLTNLWNLSNWNLEYPLLIGNELTENRPWQGKIFHLSIANRTISDEEVDRAFSQPESLADVKGSLLASYQFIGSGSYRDKTGQLPNLVWHGKPTRAIAQNKGGISVGSSHWLTTKTSVASLTQKIINNSQFTISTVVATDRTKQRGPARIISVSEDIYSRNLTLGQTGQHLVLRIRTPLTTGNGTKPDFIVPNVFADKNPHHLIITYGDSALRIYVDSLQNSYFFALSPEAALFWHPSPFGGGIYLSSAQTDFYKFLYYIFIFAPLGLIVALISSKLQGLFIFRVLWLGGGIIFPALILEGLLATLNQRPMQLSNVLLTMTIPLGTMLLLKIQAALKLQNLLRGENKS